MTPAAHFGSAGSIRSAPTMTSDPRGSLTTAERKVSNFSRKTASRSATLPPPRSGRAGDDDARRLAAGVGIDDGDARRPVRHRDTSRRGNLRALGDAVVDHLEHGVALGAGERQTRGSRGLAAEAAFLDGELDVLHELDVGVEVEQRHVPAVNFAGLFPLAGGGEVPQVLILGGEGVDESGDPADGAEHDGLEGEVVDAGEDGVAVADSVDEVRDAADVGGGFLDGDEVALVVELGEHFGGDVDAVGDGIVVDEDGQAGGAGDGAEVFDRLARVGLVDHGGKDHDAVGAEAFHVAA